MFEFLITPRSYNLVVPVLCRDFTTERSMKFSIKSIVLSMPHQSSLSDSLKDKAMPFRALAIVVSSLEAFKIFAYDALGIHYILRVSALVLRGLCFSSQEACPMHHFKRQPKADLYTISIFTILISSSGFSLYVFTFSIRWTTSIP